MFINDNDVGTDCEGSAELGEHTDVQTVREQHTDFSSGEVERNERKGGRKSVTEEEKRGGARGGMRETAFMMCMRKVDSERQGERV